MVLTKEVGYDNSMKVFTAVDESLCKGLLEIGSYKKPLPLLPFSSLTTFVLPFVLLTVFQSRIPPFSAPSLLSLLPSQCAVTMLAGGCSSWGEERVPEWQEGNMFSFSSKGAEMCRTKQKGKPSHCPVGLPHVQLLLLLSKGCLC